MIGGLGEPGPAGCIGRPDPGCGGGVQSLWHRSENGGPHCPAMGLKEVCGFGFFGLALPRSIWRMGVARGFYPDAVRTSISFISRKKASRFFVGWPWILSIYCLSTFLQLKKDKK